MKINMGTNKIIVSSRNGNRTTSGAIIVRREGNIKEGKAVVFSCGEARILDSYIDKMKGDR